VAHLLSTKSFGIVRGTAGRIKIYVQWYYKGGPFQQSLLYVHSRNHLETLSVKILESTHTTYDPRDEHDQVTQPTPLDIPSNLHYGNDTRPAFTQQKQTRKRPNPNSS